MHIPDASDNVMAAFEAHEIDELVAFCGQVLARGRWFSRGGARKDAPICPVCAEADEWGWDPDAEQWLSPYEEAHQ
jgi:hypothetical protein